MRLAAITSVFASLLMLDGAKTVQPSRCPMTVTYEFYDVTGATADEMRDSLLQHGPKDGAGNPRFAVANWSVSYEWPETTDWTRGPVDVSVSCTARVLLPRLKPTRGMSKELIRDWYSFSDRLRIHENNHLRNVQETAPLIRSRIDEALAHGRKLSVYKAHSIASGVLAEIRALDRSYDHSTNHGESEGAWSLG